MPGDSNDSSLVERDGMSRDGCEGAEKVCQTPGGGSIIQLHHMHQTWSMWDQNPSSFSSISSMRKWNESLFGTFGSTRIVLAMTKSKQGNYSIHTVKPLVMLGLSWIIFHYWPNINEGLVTISSPSSALHIDGGGSTAGQFQFRWCHQNKGSRTPFENDAHPEAAARFTSQIKSIKSDSKDVMIQYFL